MEQKTLFMGRNGINVAVVTEKENEILFSRTTIPDDIISYGGYTQPPANHEKIIACTMAREMGFTVEIPAPDYTEVDFDFTMEELHERLENMNIFMQGRVVCLDTSSVFTREYSYQDRYCLACMDDGTIRRVDEPDGRGYATRWPSEEDLEQFRVPENLRKRFRVQLKQEQEREIEKRKADTEERNRVRAWLQKLGIPFEE